MLAKNMSDYIGHYTLVHFTWLLSRKNNVIVKVTAEDCSSCKTITTYFDDFVENYYTDKVAVINLDMDVNEDITDFLKVQSTPQIFYFKDSQLQTTILGADVEQLKIFLETILKDL